MQVLCIYMKAGALQFCTFASGVRLVVRAQPYTRGATRQLGCSSTMHNGHFLDVVNHLRKHGSQKM